MTVLKNIAIAGFKSFGARAEVPLGPLNVLIGANGSGKSNFLEAFSFLQAFGSEQLNYHVTRAGGAEHFLHFGSRTTRELSIRITFDDTDAYTLKFFPDSRDRLHFDEDSKDGSDFQYVGMSRYPDIGDKRRNTISRLQAWRLYHFHDTGFFSPMTKISKLHDNRFLQEEGSNLASFLYLLHNRYESSYRIIRNTIRLVAPFFGDFILRPLELNSETIQLQWQHRDSNEPFDAPSLSDGTLRFMALTTLLLQPANLRPEIIILDEPELGLHPYAIAILAAMLRSASNETQIILATQSPILLDHFEPDDVLIADRVERQTRIRRLELEALAEWLEDYSLGQLWEKNHFGGRPARETAGPA